SELIMATLSELREMSNEQMSAVLREACKDLFQLRIKAQTDRLDVPSELKRNRKLVARIKTIQKQRQIEVANATAGSEA
ncbi:MAG: 50S ribosomal protein L29, partial [Mariniblastus sp.]|nr:50S ribosomal protein L29 [Mariniblastus sp.]